MFFSTKICPATLIETLRVSDLVKICAAKLRKECEDLDFLLENSYSDANDLQYSLNQYKENRPESWELFLNTLFHTGRNQFTFNESVTIFFKSFSI